MSLIMDIFKNDAFSTMELTSTIERIPYQPMFLSQKDFIFFDRPLYTPLMAIEERNGVLSLIPTSERGAPPNQERTTEKRTLRALKTPRLRVGDTIEAHELAFIREFGEMALIQVAAEVARRLAGPTGLKALQQYTFEYHALAAVQGLLLDADGSQIYSWFDEFGFAAPAEVAFNLAANTANSLRPLINGIVRAMARASKGAMTASSRVVALCGDLFWDEFTNHPDVIRTFLNWSEATEIRGGNQGGAFTTFLFNDVEWVNYRGSDDNATIAIPADKVKFFPRNAPGVFERGLSPAEDFPSLGTEGKEMYVKPIFDMQREEWWRQEVTSYPLYVCKRPEVLQTGRAGA